MQTSNFPLTDRRLPDIMVNAWSLLYDEMEEPMIDRNDPNRKKPEMNC